MNRSSKKLFDDFVITTEAADDSLSSTYTSVADMHELGSGQLGFMVVCDQVTPPVGENTIVLTVTMEHSADGINFVSKYGFWHSEEGPWLYDVTPLIDQGDISSAQSTVFYAGEAAPTPGAPTQPSMRYVRLVMTVSADLSGAGATAHVTVTGCTRGSAYDGDEEEKEAERPPLPPPGSLARHEVMAAEIRSLAQSTEGLPPAARAAHIIRNFSQDTKEHMLEVERKLRALPPHARQMLFDHAGQFVRHALEMTGGIKRAPGCCDDQGDSTMKAPGACGTGCEPR